MTSYLDLRRLPREVATALGYYVYLLIDPADNRPFYVGKGKDNRVLSHLSDAAESNKQRKVAAILASGTEPKLDILAHGLKDEETAFRIEAAVIDVLGLDGLTNQVRGWQSVQVGRLTLSQAIGYYAATPVEVTEPALLIRINQLYRHDMSAQDLYEATRGVWRLGPRRTLATYAMAVFEGVVREVYQIRAWHPAWSTPYASRVPSDTTAGRWEFDGEVAAASRDRYVNRSVARYFRQGQQSPVAYVNC